MSAAPNIEHLPDTHGRVERRADGHMLVVFERPLRHAPAKVWTAIAEAEQRAVWCPGIRFEPAPGARYDIWFGDECDGPSHVSGTLGAFEPPRKLALGSIDIQVTPTDDGCALRFADVLWFDDKRTRTAFANAVLGGWHQFLDRWEIWLDEGRADLKLKEPDYGRIEVPGRP